MNNINSIISGCRKGKSASQKELYDLFCDDMFAVCCYYTGNRNEAEDVFHDGFIRIFEKIDQYKGSGPLGAWMRKIFVNCALEKFRKESKIILYPELSENLSTVEYENVESTINEKELLELVSELSPRYRMVFNLYAIEGYSHHEIAEIMGISEGTSKSNLARARLTLQRKLFKNGLVRQKQISSL